MNNAAQQTVVAGDFFPALTKNQLVPQAANFLSPAMLGELDAQTGRLCLPELYFATRVQMRQYAQGYESIVGATLLSGQLLRRKGGAR